MTVPQQLAEDVTAAVRRITPDFARALDEADELKGIHYRLMRTNDGEVRLSPSKGNKCSRALYYALTEPDPPKDRKSHYTLGMGSAMHAYVEDLPELWEQLPEDEKAKLAGCLMDRYPKAVFEDWARATLVEGGHVWTARVDVREPESKTIVDFKSAGDYPTRKIQGGEAPSFDYWIQVAIGARCAEAVHGEVYEKGRLAYWPKQPMTDWQAKSALPSGMEYDQNDPDDFLMEFEIDLTDEAVIHATDLAIRTAERVATMVDTGAGPPPRWKVGLPKGARIDPRPMGQKNMGVVSFTDPVSGFPMSGEFFDCRYCDHRPQCIEDFNQETAVDLTTKEDQHQ